MKKLLLLIIILVSANILLAQKHAEEFQITHQVINDYVSGNTSEIYDRFDDTMKAAISLEKLGEIWPSLLKQCGGFISSGDSIAVENQGYVVVNQLIDFESTDLDIRIAFNNQKQISGLFFVPPVKKKE
jgi:regulator of sigma D